VPPFDLQRLNAAGSLLVTRPSLAHFVATREELLMRAGTVLAAHRALEGRETTGKVLLLP
jgi:NADPH2:quinone reductase